MKKHVYSAPEMELIEMSVETGFAGSVSGDANEGGDGGVEN